MQDYSSYGIVCSFISSLVKQKGVDVYLALCMPFVHIASLWYFKICWFKIHFKLLLSLTFAECSWICRKSISQVKESATYGDYVSGASEALNSIVTEAKLVKTALGSSLPVSWSAEADARPFDQSYDQETAVNGNGDSSSEKVDFVSAAGFEMVETLILAAEILEDHIIMRGSSDGS